jgi:beta-lactamase class A
MLPVGTVGDEVTTVSLQAELDTIVTSCPDVAWSVSVRGLPDGNVVADIAADQTRSIASVGKLLLLVTLAAQIEAEQIDVGEVLSRRSVDPVADSGLWQHLRVDALPVDDLAVLIGSVSDNLATNVLLEHVGLDAVDAVRRSLGLARTVLHDCVRESRGPGHPPRLASGTAAELSALMAALATGSALSTMIDARVMRWLAAGTDLSMVAAATHLDPLAHATEHGPLVLHHKTGRDAGTLADVGTMQAGDAGFAYAVLASWGPHHEAQRVPALTAMAEIGTHLVGVLLDRRTTRSPEDD